MIKQDNILRFHNLSQFDSLTHGFSTTFFGNLRPSDENFNETLTHFTHELKTIPDQLVRMNQIHGNTVYIASQNDRGSVIEKTDGLVTSEKNVFLGVITADCIPFLLYDAKKGVVGAVHAGWRGLYAEIIIVAVADLIAKGSSVVDIVVGIGPSIRVCCYKVNDDFLEKFREKFGNVEAFVQRRNGEIFFNLQKVATEQLLSTGVLPENIEDGDYCTFTHEDIYSCRREGKDFGEMMGIIGQV